MRGSHISTIVMSLYNMQVYNCLQPLMISLSYQGTLNLVDRLCEDFDVCVQLWSEDLQDHLQVCIY